jgi:hypothetical protein
MRIENGGSKLTFVELVREWLDRREYDETVASIQRSLRDYDEEQALPLEEAFQEIRRKLGLPE